MDGWQRRWRRASTAVSPWLLPALAPLLAALGIADLLLRRGEPGAPTGPVWLDVLAVLVVVAPLAVRERWPFGAPVAVWLAGAAASFADGRLVPFLTAVTVTGATASCLLGALPDLRRSRLGLGVVVLSAGVVTLNDPGHVADDVLLVPALFVIAWLVGTAARSAGLRAREAEGRASRAEAERESAARLAVAEERARIAREVHDVVAHAVSVMVLQSGAVRHHLPNGMDAEREALQRVEDAGRAALTEMRRLLGALRRDDEEADLVPQPGLTDLAVLAEQVRAAGLDVRVRVEGDPVPLPAGLDLSAYRVVQEGLTNVLKHAGARRSEVVVRYGDGTVQVEVRDDGAGPEPVASRGAAAGHGLVGVAERVRLYDGEMSAGAGERGGFVLSARFALAAEKP